jgi:hypothetical protein
MRRALFLTVLGVLLVATAVSARTSTSALGDGTDYQAMLGIGGNHSIPYTTAPPTLDGTIAAGEWDGYFYTMFGPSTQAMWAEIVGWKDNEPGQGVTDGLVNQLSECEGENAAEVRTDADLFVNTWQAWDDDYLYIAIDVLDNVFDVVGTQDGGYWERDGFFHEMTFVEGSTAEEIGGGETAYAFSAMAPEDQRYSITSWNYGLGANEYTFFYGDDPDSFLGTYSMVSLTDDGYQLESRTSWAHASRYLDNWQVRSGWEFGNSYHVLDPDGCDGYGGQFQYGRDGDAGHIPGFADWILTGGPDSPTAVESTTWGAVKASF